MTKRSSTGPTAERFVEETLSLIAERGGSRGVNLREVSRRVGCAHTNAYNYFADFDDLLWTTFRRVLWIYGEYLTHDLDDTLPPREYLRRLVSNLATFPQQNPGFYRFIGSDPLDVERIPADILEMVSTMKRWACAVFAACGPMSHASEADTVCDIVLAYIDGETLNLINGRVLPAEDARGRIVANALRLYDLLTGEEGQDSPPAEASTAGSAFPHLALGDIHAG